MDQSVIVGKILRTLTSKFNYIVCSVEESNDLDSLSIDELHDSLLVHEQRMCEYREEDQALKVVYDEKTTRSRGRGGYNPVRRGGFNFPRGARGRGRGRGRF